MKNLTGIQGRLNVTGEELAPPFPPFFPRSAGVLVMPTTIGVTTAAIAATAKIAFFA